MPYHLRRYAIRVKLLLVILSRFCAIVRDEDELLAAVAQKLDGLGGAREDVVTGP